MPPGEEVISHVYFGVCLCWKPPDSLRIASLRVEILTVCSNLDGCGEGGSRGKVTTTLPSTHTHSYLCSELPLLCVSLVLLPISTSSFRQYKPTHIVGSRDLPKTVRNACWVRKDAIQRADAVVGFGAHALYEMPRLALRCWIPWGGIVPAITIRGVPRVHPSYHRKAARGVPTTTAPRIIGAGTEGSRAQGSGIQSNSASHHSEHSRRLL